MTFCCSKCEDRLALDEHEMDDDGRCENCHVEDEDEDEEEAVS